MNLTRIGQAALAIVAVHLLDDAFVQREPGLSVWSHLTGGVLSIALVLAAAVLLPRLPAGAAASIELAFGLTALGAGLAVPVRHAFIDRPSGDDWTGVLATAAGLVLVAVGAVTLWRSRRGGTRTRRYARRGGLALAGVLTGFFVVFPVAFSYAITHKARSPVEAKDLSRPYEKISLRTSDGLTLRGWYVPSRNGAAVIAFPGRSGPVKHARMLVRHGYGVLLLDRRGEGESDGDANVLGWGGWRDVVAAVGFLERRHDVERGRIGGLGLSVGGELMLEAATHAHGLSAVVSEGAGARSLREDAEIESRSKWLELPVAAGMTAATAVFADRLPPTKLHTLVARITQPVFFVYATHGQGGENMNPHYHALARGPKQLWEIEDAKHTGGITAHPAEYEHRVVGFFDRYLAG
jgi:dienelactone hydrolase